MPTKGARKQNAGYIRAQKNKGLDEKIKKNVFL
jgi:hypothetical protein